MKRLICLVAFSLAAAGSAAALDLTSITFHDSMLFLDSAQVLDGNGHPTSAASPILDALGASFDLKLSDLFLFEPSLDIYGTYYKWLPDQNRAVPAELENREAFVLGFILDTSFYIRWAIADRLQLQFGLGPAFILPAGFIGVQENDQTTQAGIVADVKSINGWFYSEGRFVRPSATLSFRFKLRDKIDFGVWGRVIVPIYHWWANDGLPFTDNLIGNAGVLASILL